METPDLATSPDPFLAEVLDKFRTRFEPTDDIGKATHFYSTADIHRAITSLNPGSEISQQQVYEALKLEGYSWQIDDSRFTFDLKWLLLQVR